MMAFMSATFSNRASMPTLIAASRATASSLRQLAHPGPRIFTVFMHFSLCRASGVRRDRPVPEQPRAKRGQRAEECDQAGADQNPINTIDPGAVEQAGDNAERGHQ